MHAFIRKSLFVLIAASAVFATGCRKKPARPDPSATVIGQPGMLNPGDASGFGAGMNNGLTEAGSGLLPQGAYEEGDKIITAPERAKLDAAKAYLDANPAQRLLIEGRCDWRGTGDYNLGLGDRRASAARQYLVTIGVPETRIEVLSKGDLEAVENASEDVMAKDRRADLVVLKK
ncbi:MAG: OmpA family protein [Opitutaceae bacterium]|nr:OmpA family protein [Opitutaceae bacterium]